MYDAQIKVTTTKPITSREISNVILAARKLYVSCSLIVQERFDDALDYTETSNWKFENEFRILVESDCPVNQDLPSGAELTLTFPGCANVKAIQALQMLLHL